MAAVNGVNKTKYAAGASGSNYLAMGEYQAPVKCIQEQYEASGLATGSTISCVNLPKDAKVIGCSISWDALGTSSTIAVGDALDADRYIAATSSVAAGNSSAIRVDAIGYKIGTTATDDVPVITVTTSASINGTIKVAFFFVQ